MMEIKTTEEIAKLSNIDIGICGLRWVAVDDIIEALDNPKYYIDEIIDELKR